MNTKQDKWTSTEAVTSIEAEVNKIQKYVLEYLEACGSHGSTHQEAEGYFANLYGPSTVRARFAELERMGLVRESGKWRRTKAKRRAIVWVHPLFEGDASC